MGGGAPRPSWKSSRTQASGPPRGPSPPPLQPRTEGSQGQPGWGLCRPGSHRGHEAAGRSPHPGLRPRPSLQLRDLLKAAGLPRPMRGCLHSEGSGNWHSAPEVRGPWVSGPTWEPGRPHPTDSPLASAWGPRSLQRGAASRPMANAAAPAHHVARPVGPLAGRIPCADQTLSDRVLVGLPPRCGSSKHSEPGELPHVQGPPPRSASLRAPRTVAAPAEQPTQRPAPCARPTHMCTGDWGVADGVGRSRDAGLAVAAAATAAQTGHVDTVEAVGACRGPGAASSSPILAGASAGGTPRGVRPDAGTGPQARRPASWGQTCLLAVLGLR